MSISFRMVHYYLLLTTPQGDAPKVACHWAMNFIPFREVSPMSISFRMALLTINYSLLTDIAPQGISANGLARPSVRAHSWLKKLPVDTRKYVETFLCFPWIAFPSQVRTATFSSV